MSYKRNQSLIFLTIIESNVGVCFKAAFLRVSNACRIDVCLCTIFETGLGFQTTAHWQRYFLIHHYNHVICNNGNFNERINFDINNIHFINFSWRILFFFTYEMFFWNALLLGDNISRNQLQCCVLYIAKFKSYDLKIVCTQNFINYKSMSKCRA